MGQGRDDRQSPTKGRAWCYTLNNYTDDDVVRLESIECLRHVVGREVGEAGTPHLQGYIRFKEPCRFSWWKNQVPKAHVELRKGTEEQAVTYCRKEGSLVIDKGVAESEPPRLTGKKRDVEAAEVIGEIEAGHTYKQIRTDHKIFCFWHRRQVLEYKRDTIELEKQDEVQL